jgi:hypothetical protein
MRYGGGRLALRSFVTLATSVVAVAALSSPLSAQILYDTAPWDGVTEPTSSATAITLFDSEPSGQPGYGCMAVLKTIDGASNQTTLRGVDADIAYHVAVAFSVSAAQVGSWSFRWGADLGGGGTLLLDGTELQARWSDFYWANTFTDPDGILEGSGNLTMGMHTLELYGFEDCCDGSADAQFMAPGGTWMDISAANLTLTQAGPCSGPAVWLDASVSPSAAVPPSTQLTYSISYQQDGTAAVPSAMLVATLDPSTSFVSASGSGQYNTATRTITWSLGDLALGASGQATATILISATPTATVTTTLRLTGTGAPTQTDAITTVVGISGDGGVPPDGGGTGGAGAGGSAGTGGAGGHAGAGGAGGHAGASGGAGTGGAAGAAGQAGGSGGAAGTDGGTTVVADAGSDAAAGGETGHGGTSGATGSQGGAAGGAGGHAGASGGSSGGGGCGCAVATGPSTAGLLGLMPFAALLLRVRRRRSRR